MKAASKRNAIDILMETTTSPRVGYKNDGFIK